jgi:hypothetical protein
MFRIRRFRSSLVLSLPNLLARFKSDAVPFFWPVLHNISSSLRGIEEEGNGVYRNILCHGVVFVEDIPSHINRMEHAGIVITLLRVELLFEK